MTVTTADPSIARAAFEAGFDLASDHPLTSRKDFNDRWEAWLATQPADRLEDTQAEDLIADAIKTVIAVLPPEDAADAIVSGIWHAVSETHDDGALVGPHGDAAKAAIDLEALTEALTV